MRELGDVLVTGHAGYVGGALSPLILQRAKSATFCDANWFTNTPLSGGQDFRSLTTSDLGGIDTIIHLAGLSNESVATAFPLTEEAREVAAFAKTARDAGVERFVFASSAAVYNNGNDPCQEGCPANPHSGYAKVKFDSEKVLEELATARFSIAVLRFASCFGWAPNIRPDLLINRMVARALDGETLQLASDGTSWRPFVHVEDAAEALCLAGQMDVKTFEIHNVVGDEANRSVAETLDVIVDALRTIDIEVAVEPPAAVVDPRSYTIDGSELAARGFEPRWSVHDGVIDLANRLRVNANAKATDVGVQRTERLTDLHESDQLCAQLRRVDTTERATDELHAMLISPAGVGQRGLDRVLESQRAIMANSQYRLTGAWATKAEGLLMDELALPKSWDVLAMRSGTDSLTRALWLAGVRAGSKVVVPDLAFHAVAATVLAVGATPVITDITSDTWNLDPSLVEQELASPDVQAVVAVDNYGTPADWAALGNVCRAGGVPLIVDACESLGATRPDCSVSEHADYVALSFSFTKPIHAAGMGGALCAPSEEVERVMAAPDQLVRQARLPELNAAYLCEAWPSLHGNIAHLRKIYGMYTEALEPRGFQAQSEVGVSTRIHAPFLLPAEIAEHREELLKNVEAVGIQARAQFPSQARLLNLGEPPPISNDVDARVVSLPSGAGLDLNLIPEIAEQFLAQVDRLHAP